MARAEQLLSAIEWAEFPHLENLIHVFVGGSELHGAKVRDTDDLDIYGVYLEPPELILRFGEKRVLRVEHGGERTAQRTRRH
jgi:hypothetical protein